MLYNPSLIVSANSIQRANRPGAGSPVRFCRTKKIVIFVLLSAILLFKIKIKDQSYAVIEAHSFGDIRCSHVPPAPEQINHVWLDNANFTETVPTLEATGEAHDKSIEGRESHLDVRSRRNIEFPSGSKRHSSTQFAELENSSSSTNGIQESLWTLLNTTKRTPASAQQAAPPAKLPARIGQGRDDLVPMKIQVYYDSSVYALDKRKVQSINETVMPTVVKFFEEVLQIKREYTIDKFRISRRCINSTIYHTKDIMGGSRPYCADRCEEQAVCGEIIVPKEHLTACSYCNSTTRRCTTNYESEGKGVAGAQLLLYVSAKQTVRCKKDQTIAYAAHCAQDTKTDRPVAGHANLCPASISTDPRDLKALIATVKHELTHVLGFSVSLFAYYRDQHGQPLTERESSPGPIPVDPTTGYARWSDRVIRRVVRPNWVTGEGPVDREVHMVVTPTVVREVRRHFNCSTLEGAELEDQGSDGTSMTHWEKRLFENEAMTGTHTQNSVYSRLTLAVLQDTGWYVANFSRADKLDWGRDLGCDFAKKSCKSWIDERRARGQSIRPFCDKIKGDILQLTCTDDRGAKAVCNMRHYREPLPGVYQNFDRLDDAHPAELGHFGGSVDLADYCPFIQEFTWLAQNVTVHGSRCDLGDDTTAESDKNAALEQFGADSRCFEHVRRWEQRSCTHRRHWHHFGAGCYKYACANGHLNILAGNQSYPCYYANQVVRVEQVVGQWLHNGSVICPACDKICPASKCAAYEKDLVEQIMYTSGSAGAANSTDDMVHAILGEALNSIDTRGDVSNLKKLYTKYKSVWDETNELLERRKLLLQQNEEAPQKTSAISFDLFTRQPARHPLSCSGAAGLHWSPAVFMTMISLIYVKLVQSRRFFD